MIALADPTRATTLNEACWFLRAAQAPRLRSIREFAESEIIIPDGPFQNETFSCERQPYTKLWFEALEMNLWNRYFATGPSQTGKTLACYIVPLLFHLFEIGETVICGLPSMDMAGDKWREDIRPAIESSRYRDLLPTTGQGSKGGMVEAVQFNHGPTLRFMSGGGGDKKRAGFTSRVLVITEVDGMDECGGKSREADKITQLEARTRAFGKRKRIYGECTVSVEQGRTWQEYTKGTASRIFLPCPKCGVFVHPTRDSLAGWQDATDEHEAERNSAIHCPECGEAWTERERADANHAGKLVHRGQEIEPDGTIHGDLPATNTLGFRWDAVNNLFAESGEIGAEEWKASRADDEDNAEKQMRQFIWALPHQASAMDSTPLEVAAIVARTAYGGKGIAPPGASIITVGCDVGKYLLHWCAVAWFKGGSGHVIDYGRQEVASAHLGVERAIQAALRELRDGFAEGWKHGDQMKPPNAVWVDAGYMTDVVYTFIRESRAPYMASDGLGQGQEYRTSYSRPKTTGAIVKLVGEGYHFAALPNKGVTLAEVHADHWKTYTHERLTTPLDEPGAMTLFQASPSEHLSFAKHLTAERQVEEFVAGKGNIVKWVRDKKNNHWFDALYNACAAGHYCGVRLVREAVRPKEPKQAEEPSRFRPLRIRR